MNLLIFFNHLRKEDTTMTKITEKKGLLAAIDNVFNDIEMYLNDELHTINELSDELTELKKEIKSEVDTTYYDTSELEKTEIYKREYSADWRVKDREARLHRAQATADGYNTIIKTLEKLI